MKAILALKLKSSDESRKFCLKIPFKMDCFTENERAISGKYAQEPKCMEINMKRKFISINVKCFAKSFGLITKRVSER